MHLVKVEQNINLSGAGHKQRQHERKEQNCLCFSRHITQPNANTLRFTSILHLHAEFSLSFFVSENLNQYTREFAYILAL
jgi:hypothetical protein